MNLKEQYKKILSGLLNEQGQIRNMAAWSASVYGNPGIDSTVRNIVEPKGKASREDELRQARIQATHNNAFNSQFAPRRYKSWDSGTTSSRWAKTKIIKDEPQERQPSEEEKTKREATRRLLNTVHHFSREHGIQLKAEHIEGIDFSDSNFAGHIKTISSRLGI